MYEYAASFVGKDEATEQAAIQGALDILSERVADDAENRQLIRALTLRKGSIHSVAADAGADTLYQQYYDYTEPVAKVPPHRILAMNRGERDNALKVSIVAPADDILRHLLKRHLATSPGRTRCLSHRCWGRWKMPTSD